MTEYLIINTVIGIIGLVLFAIIEYRKNGKLDLRKILGIDDEDK